MAKKIKFPLKMKNGVPIRNIDELRENFSLDDAVVYLANGKLVTWLRDRYLNDLADEISTLDEDDIELGKKLCDIFEVSYEDNLEAVNHQKKIMLLKKYTMEQEFFQVIDQVAFDENDLRELLSKDEKIIYLCNGRFSIPLDKNNIHYIGIAKPIAVIASDKKIDFDKKGIIFEDVKFDDKYQKVIAEQEEKINFQSDFRYTGSTGYTYTSYLNRLLSISEKEQSKKLYELLIRLWGNVEFDIDKTIERKGNIITGDSSKKHSYAMLIYEINCALQEEQWAGIERYLLLMAYKRKRERKQKRGNRQEGENRQKSILITDQLNISLAMIYNYENLNDYGKIIMEQSSLEMETEWKTKYLSLDALYSTESKYDAANKFIKYCTDEEKSYGVSSNRRGRKYQFIFWALMILVVDDRAKENYLSLICDFSVLLQISDEEMQDIFTVIKNIYCQRSSDNLLTSTVKKCFRNIIPEKVTGNINYDDKKNESNVHERYREDSYLKDWMSEEEKKESEELSDKISVNLNEIAYSLRDDIEDFVKNVKVQIEEIDYDTNQDTAFLKEMIKYSQALDMADEFIRNL